MGELGIFKPVTRMNTSRVVETDSAKSPFQGLFFRLFSGWIPGFLC